MCLKDKYIPQITVVIRPNGAGKSTIAPYFLPKGGIYLNADEFAKELKLQSVISYDIAPGRYLLILGTLWRMSALILQLKGRLQQVLMPNA